MFSGFLAEIFYTKAILLLSVSLTICLWLAYFIYRSATQEWANLNKIYSLYIIHSFSIVLWIICNVYFHTRFLVIYPEHLAVIVDKAANIFLYIALASIYIFSCLILSIVKKSKINLIQIILILIMSLFSIYTNMFSDLTVTKIKVESASNFSINFGTATPIFYTVLIVITILSLVNLFILYYSTNNLKKVKSIYILIGVITFIISTNIFYVIIPLVFNIFYFTWLPPALSIIELIFVGYAISFHRFYSWKYIYFLIFNSFIVIAGFMIPIIILGQYFYLKVHIIVLLLWALTYSLAWKSIWKHTGQYISLIIYGNKKTPVDAIFLLKNDFQISIQQANKKLSKLLQIDEKYILIADAQMYNLYSSYLMKIDSVLLIEEVKYHVNGTQNNQLRIILDQMSQHQSAMILPLYDNQYALKRLFIIPNKSDGSIYYSEEISALRKLFKYVESYIYSEYNVKQSEAVAHSIAHEMHSTLAQIQLHLEKISNLTTNEIHITKALDEIEYAKSTIYQGNQIINTMLQEARQPTLNSNTIKSYSIQELTNKTTQNKIEINFKSNNESHQVLIKNCSPETKLMSRNQIFKDPFTYKKNRETRLEISYSQKLMKLLKRGIICQSIYGHYTTLILSDSKTNNSIKEINRLKHVNKFHKKTNSLVLITDDNKSQRLLVGLYLKKMGVEIIEAHNGQQALEKVRQHHFDLILMDIQMPIMDGYTASLAIKKDYPKLPIIALSGEACEDDIDKMYRIMDDRLGKPVNNESLSKIINKWINR